MQTQVLSISVPVSRQRLFNYLADIHNLPEWATEFCHGLEQVQGRYRVDTPMGKMYCQVQVQEHTGVIDFWTSVDGIHGEILPTRVLSIDTDNSLYMVGFIQTEGVSDELFQQQSQSLQHELQGIVRLFSSEPAALQG